MIFSCIKPASIHLCQVETPKQCVIFVQSYWQRHQSSVSDVLLVSQFLTLNRFQTLFWCSHCWIWTRKCWMGSVSFSELAYAGTFFSLSIWLKLTFSLLTVISVQLVSSVQQSFSWFFIPQHCIKFYSTKGFG